MPDTTTEKTAAQLPYFGLGGDLTGFGYGYGSRTTTTVGGGTQAILPMVAAVVGSAAYEGKNPYANVGYGGGAFGSLPGFGIPFAGTYETYRRMSAHPTLVLAAAAVFCPILAAGWSIEVDEKRAPKKAKEYVENYVMPRRTGLLRDALRALRMGWSGFENVFATKDGWTVLGKAKYLMPDRTEIRTDPHGNFAGLRQGMVTIDGDAAMIYTYDREGDNWHGRSRHENARRAWSNYLAVEDNLYRLGIKAASIVAKIGAPPNAATTVPDSDQDTKVQARGIASALSSGQSIYYPNMVGLSPDDIARNAELAGKSFWSIETLDVGNPGPMATSLIEQLRYYDALLVRAWLVPERSVIEASQSGSRADSESHGGITTADCDQVHADIVDTINGQLLDPLIRENFGVKAVGTVKLRPRPLIDEQRIVAEDFIKALLANNATIGEVVRHTKMREMMDKLNIPQNDLEWDDGAEMQGVAAAGGKLDQPPRPDDVVE